MKDTLVALADGKTMGEVLLRGDRLSFCYSPDWQASESSFPLSLSMPLVAQEHGHRVIEAFLWGLLPDNDGVLERWGRRFQVSARNPFRLLQHVGEDCAGAVQFVRPDRLEPLLVTDGPASIRWLDEEDLVARITAVVDDASATRLGGDSGQFSLAGAQPKTALYFDGKNARWGVPEGQTPTTHILKPATGAFAGHVENEHFCLRLAARLGLATARSWVMQCGEIPVIVIERFDRVERAGVMGRVHQEDFCQAAGIRPQLKYQNQGGPSPKEIGEILWASSSSPEADVLRFADSLIFHWLTAGTDAHAKNYSMLIAAGSRARLAPLYDLASAVPYPQQIQPRKATMAMKIGSHYRIREIRSRDWAKLARELRISPGEIVDRIGDMADRISVGTRVIAESLKREGINHPVVDTLAASLPLHVEERLRLWGSADSDMDGTKK